jgi:hypothetical protein
VSDGREHVGVVAEPTEGTRVGEHGQDGLLLVVDAVLGQELAEFLGADAALAGLDAADLRAAARG